MFDPQVWATKLIASVAPRVKTISSTACAPKKTLSFSRDASKASLASKVNA
jgi:hypothetical protein